MRAEITSVSCSATTACVVGTNASTGPGVSGTSAKGYGLSGTSTSSLGLYATSKTGAAMKATAASNNALYASNNSNGYPTIYAVQGGAGTAVSGKTTNGTGMTAVSTGGVGLLATSSFGIAVEAESTNGEGLFATGATEGLYASSYSGYGVYGASSSGYGIFASSYSGDGLDASSSSGYGIVSRSGSNVGVYTTSSSGNGVDASGGYIGLIGRSPTTGYPIVATDTNSNNLFYVDGKGNVSYHGGLYTFVKGTRGSVRAFGTNAASPTTEDVGSSALRGGTVRVTLDPAFANSIAGNGAYHVFLTPAGDSRGLFVSERDANGFVVRESQSGRSSVGFDYRIVATTAGHVGERAAFVTTASEPRALLAPIKAAPSLRPPVGVALSPARR